MLGTKDGGKWQGPWLSLGFLTLQVKSKGWVDISNKFLSDAEADDERITLWEALLWKYSLYAAYY